MAQGSPRLSVVVLTWNEERNIAACLAALARQTNRDFEVRVVDAASTDRTAESVRAMMSDFPVPIDLHVAPRRLSVGEARNLGAQESRAPAVAFLSADTEPNPHWVEQALKSLERADLVFGRQIHAPLRRNVGAAVRGLRYHFPPSATDHPERYASNANSAMRRRVLKAFPFGESPGASAVDDLLLARRASAAGHRMAYNPEMVVRHHDVDSWRAELTKNRREGLGWGQYAQELGTHRAILAWAGILALSILFAIALPSVYTLAAAVIVLWLPAARRVWRRRHDMHPTDLLLGFLATPPFDLAFLAAYVRARIVGRPAPSPPKLHEVET